MVPGENATGQDPSPAEAMTAEMQRELVESMSESGTPPPKFEPTNLVLLEAATSVRRGGEITIRGRLLGENAPIEGAKVQAYLGPPGTQSVAGAVRVGEGRTDTTGNVVIRGLIPGEHSTGRWSLFLIYPGDQRFSPSVAE